MKSKTQDLSRFPAAWVGQAVPCPPRRGEDTASYLYMRVKTGTGTGSFAHLLKLTGLIAVVAILGALGCNRAPGPPPPLPAEQISVEMQKAFAQASTEVKALIAEIDRALTSKDYPAAYQRVQFICNLPEATKEQRVVSTRAMLTLTALLQSAQAQGDQNAAEALKLQQRTR